MIDGPIKVVGLGGSLAQSSTSLAALKIALDAAAAAGAEVELFDIRALNLPMYSPDTREAPAAAQRLAEAACEAAGFFGAARSITGRSAAPSKTPSTGCTSWPITIRPT